VRFAGVRTRFGQRLGRLDASLAGAVRPVVSRRLVQAAITYYGAYQDEIDQWIEMNDQEAAEARAAWMAGQAAVKR
jgi:hypothetical protein